MQLALIGCEYTGTVTDAMRKVGLKAYSCDILPTEGNPMQHYQEDILKCLRRTHWDLGILHIPCTAMALCGNKHYGVKDGVPLPKHQERLDAIEWSCQVVEQALKSCDRLAVENPASVIFPELRKRFGAKVQFVQPWQHGHPEQKKTGFALWNLPELEPTNIVYDEMMELPRHKRERVFMMGPSPTRGLDRSRFYSGIAKAMADQWGFVTINGL